MLCGGSDSVIIPAGIILFIIIYIDLASYLWLSHIECLCCRSGWIYCLQGYSVMSHFVHSYWLMHKLQQLTRTGLVAIISVFNSVK